LGRAEVSWTIREGRFFLEAVIPNGSTARVLLPAHPEGRIDEVGGGRHRWEYDLPIAPRPTYSFDTPLTELTADEKVWRALMAVFSSHFPGAMGAGNGGSVGSIGKSLRDILVLIPGDKTALESELLEALEVR